MSKTMKAVEIMGRVDSEGQLHLDEPLTAITPGPVRVILLAPEDEDIDERDWLKAAARNPIFDFLKDSEEDVYTISDGKPFDDEG
jgi:hypothetical protein